MTFTVVWASAAEKELASIWMTAPDRSVVAAMAAAIDAMLRAAPLEHGESRGGDRRILIQGNLAVIAEVLVEDRLVRVLAVWAFVPLA